MIDGFLIVDKPAGMTSHDVVARLRRALGTKRMGHAGTLDPMATGVLVVGVGFATRLLRFVEATSKGYRGEVTFGARTDSLDATGTVIETADASQVTRAALEAILPRFTGGIEQVPPMVSAIKIGGEKLHVKARRGETIERPPRAVTIHELRCAGFDEGPPPRATLEVTCSPGTYIRTLADDLGVALGTVAHLSSLRRTAVGAMSLDRAVALDDVSRDDVLPILTALEHLTRREITDEQADAVRHGRRIENAGIAGDYLAIHDGLLVAVLRDDTGGTRVEVGFPAPLR